MLRPLSRLLILGVLSSQQLYAGTDEYREELQSIRHEFGKRIKNLEENDNERIFSLSKELAEKYQVLAKTICLEVMGRHPGIEKLVSVALSGSVAWGEPTLKSDIEVVYLVRNYENMKEVFQFALDFADEFKKINDKDFDLDQITTEDFTKDQISLLEKPPAIFTIEDIQEFNLTWRHRGGAL